MIILVSVVLIFLIYILYLIYGNNTYLNKIPMPPCNLVLGHLLEFKNPTEILGKLTDYTLQYGGLIRIYTPPKQRFVLVTDHKVLQALMTSEQTLYKSSCYSMSERWLGSGLIASGGTKWKERRRMLTPCFGRVTLLKNYVEVFEKQGNILTAKLERELDNRSIDLFPLMKMFTMDVLCETSMGSSTNCQNNQNLPYLRSIEKMCEVLLRRTTSFFKAFDIFYELTRDYNEEIEALGVIDSFFEKIIVGKRTKEGINEDTSADKQEFKESSEKYKLTFLDLLLECWKKGANLSLGDIRDEVNNFMFGGHDTTATALAFVLYCLGRHQEVQEKVIEEQTHIFGDLSEAVENTYSDLQDMRYLEMVINEALRIYPPVPIIGRRLSEDIELDSGIVLPKDLSIMIFIYGCHHNPKYFPEPNKFIPERFEKDDIPVFGYIPFSAGHRNCIGRKFAILQLKSCVSKIVRHFRLLPSHPEYALELLPALTLIARNGIRISLERRHFV